MGCSGTVFAVWRACGYPAEVGVDAVVHVGEGDPSQFIAITTFAVAVQSYEKRLKHGSLT